MKANEGRIGYVRIAKPDEVRTATELNVIEYEGSMTKRYLAIEIRGDVHILNDLDELGGLIDNDIPHKVLGEVCDDKEYGDRCNTDCTHFCMGTCPAKPIRDINGQLWHVLTNK